MATYYKQLFQLIRAGLGISEENVVLPDANAWEWIFSEAKWQSVLGVVFEGVNKAVKDHKPSLQLLMRWVGISDMLKRRNELFDQDACELTKLLDSNHIFSVVLKGQGNEMLYPVKGCRTPGDIDLYMEGGFDFVMDWLRQHGFFDADTILHRHHVIIKSSHGVEVEVHFFPSSGLFAYWHNKSLLKILNDEVRNSTLSDRGFRVPTSRFNLLMQLAHIQRHYWEGGVGLRQVTDFYYVLLHASESDRLFASQQLGKLGMKKMASALMWVLQQVLLLDEAYMIAQPHAGLGRLLMEDICKGGNFGQRLEKTSDSFILLAFMRRIRAFRLLRFGVAETIGEEWEHLCYVVSKYMKL